MPLVSIVVPTRGGAQRIPRLLEALRAQVGCEWEAIFVLDGDIDDSAGVLAAQAADLPVRVVVFPENRGRAAALNAGFAAAQGGVLVRCDDDVEPAPDFAAAHAGLHEGRRIGIVGPCEDVFEDTAYARAYGLPAERRVREHSYALAADEGWRLWSGNVSVTREVYDEVGDYDTAFREYGWEDVDWGYRLHLRGVPVIAAREVQARHHNPARSLTERADRAYAAGASQRRFLAKHGAAAAALVESPARWDSPWNLAVGLTATVLTPRTLPRVSRVLDRLIERAPRAVGEKLAALGVEAAGRAGRRSR